MKRFDTVTQNKSDKIEVKRVITFHRYPTQTIHLKLLRM